MNGCEGIKFLASIGSSSGVILDDPVEHIERQDASDRMENRLEYTRGIGRAARPDRVEVEANNKTLRSMEVKS